MCHQASPASSSRQLLTSDWCLGWKTVQSPGCFFSLSFVFVCKLHLFIVDFSTCAVYIFIWCYFLFYSKVWHFWSSGLYSDIFWTNAPFKTSWTSAAAHFSFHYGSPVRLGPPIYSPLSNPPSGMAVLRLVLPALVLYHGCRGKKSSVQSDKGTLHFRPCWGTVSLCWPLRFPRQGGLPRQRHAW